MKYAHIDETSNKLLGWYDSDIHEVIPTPSIEVTSEQWQYAIDNSHNKVNPDGTTELFDFRSLSEIEAANSEAIRSLAKQTGEIYTLNGKDYQIPFMKDDADALMQVNAAFQLGVISTVIYFTNGTKLPITPYEFQDFAMWFVEKRNQFFV